LTVYLPGTSVNKGKKEGRGLEKLRPFAMRRCAPREASSLAP
jgi:hypothetical protein